MDKIENKVEASGLLTLDLETLYDRSERIIYDIKDNLTEGILRGKIFREYLKFKYRFLTWQSPSGTNVL